MKSVPFVVLLAAVAASLLGSACSGAAPAAAPTQAAPAAERATGAAKPGAQPTGGEGSQWLDGARKEGQVLIYGIGGPGLQPLKEAFEARYPGITVDGLDQSGQQTREKIIAEAAAGQLKADLASAGGTSTAELVKKGLMDEYRSPEAANLIAEVVDPRGYMTPRVINMYGMTVNTSVVGPPDEPKSWQALLDPKWRGKIAMGDPRGSGSGGTILFGLEKTFGPEYVQKLATQDIFFGRENSALLTQVVRGEQAILLTATSRNAVQQIQRGAPLKFVKPEEGVAVTPISIGVVKNAPHPNAARLFLDWVLTEEGQAASAKAGDTPARKDAKAAFPESDITGVKILPRDDNEAGTPAEVDRMKRWDQLFFKQ